VTASRREALLGLSGLAAGTTVAAVAAPISVGEHDPQVDPGNDLQRRYDALAAAGGGTLRLPVGTLRLALVMHSRAVHLRGEGRNATILAPRDAALPVLRQEYSTARWDAVTISDLTLQGAGEGIAIDYGNAAVDRFGGRTILRNVRLAGFETCIRRPSGNIGLYLEDCQFDDACFHIWGSSLRTTDGAIMHNGVLSAHRCHFQGATKAVLYTDSDVAGSGQIIFDQCLFEANPGFVFAFARFESRDGVPGISVRSCWNEANATGGNASALQLGGKHRTPVFLFADRVGSITFEDTPLGSVVLLGDTTIVTRSCALDLVELVEVDRAASLVHYDARIFGGNVVAGLTRSVANGNQKNFGPTGAIFRLPHRLGIIYPEINDAHAVGTCGAPMIVDGSRRMTTHSVPDAILPGVRTSQQLDLAAGDAGYAAMIAVPQPTYIAWTFAYRKISGGRLDFVVAGRAGVSTVTMLDAAEWTTIGGIAFVDRPLDQLGFLLRAAAGASVRMGGYQLICFPTRAAATEMLNDGLFRDRPV